MSFTRGTGKRSIIIGPGIPILIDSLNSENHSSVVRYTRYPVESGRFGSDHAQEQPDEVELNILVTDTPLQDGVSSFEGRHRVIYAQLRIWQKLKVSLILVLGLRSYINMHIQELNPSKQPSDGKSIKITIKFVEVQLTDLGLAALAAALLVDSSIAHSATSVIPIGVI
jgi:hypothetical protein